MDALRRANEPLLPYRMRVDADVDRCTLAGMEIVRSADKDTRFVLQ